jgi:hypothetical protein
MQFCQSIYLKIYFFESEKSLKLQKQAKYTVTSESTLSQERPTPVGLTPIPPNIKFITNSTLAASTH